MRLINARVESMDACALLAFFDTRGCEGEIKHLKDELKTEKKAVSEARKREKSWESEARELRKDWEKKGKKSYL